jgi:hypothetical protein
VGLVNLGRGIKTPDVKRVEIVILGCEEYGGREGRRPGEIIVFHLYVVLDLTSDLAERRIYLHDDASLGFTSSDVIKDEGTVRTNTSEHRRF